MATTPPVTPNAKWTDELHKLFVELCAGEVIKGNKVGTTLNKEGWVAVHTEFVRQKNVLWTMRQFKNHWEAMKPDYQLFKKLKFGESGLGWNENTKTIEASPIWWLHKTQLILPVKLRISLPSNFDVYGFMGMDLSGKNPKYVKFRDKDLSLYIQLYDTLFGDIVATGQRARAANTYSSVNLEVGEEFTEVMAPSLNKSKSSGTKRKKSGAEFVRAGLDSLAAAMSYMSTQSIAATDDAALNAAVDILDDMEQVPSGIKLYFYARRYLLEKGNRTLFLRARSNELRYGEIMYNFTRRAGGNFNDN
ncbi:hypothetical protein POM88_018223 [Heracleum sosnowskyi]|uniref:Myb/SANT-like domain-containing protein n=1 Tax=Heracleum sosnowskyi TaxID=360622 RepID=A0AAD8MUJ1_9APIA|nr:hypothetical protein POM88_018223 [Heracleum sosnowskyi]